MGLRESIDAYAPCCPQERIDRQQMLEYLDQYPDILLRSNSTAHFSASAWVVNPARSRVLMIYHNIYRSWAWPGGHADGEADLLAVALREVREETGATALRPARNGIYSLEILPVEAHVRRGTPVAAHLHLNLTYLLEAEEDQALAMKPDENSGVRWFGLNEAVAASCEPIMRVIYQKLNDRLLREG